MIVEQPTEHVLVVGFVNIHTHQAEQMLEYFEHEAQPWSESEGSGDHRHVESGAASLPRRGG